MNLATASKITWCPGCPNSAILVAFREAVTELCEGKQVALENIVAGAGIGCHGKISDYLNMNTFTSLHGRIVPAMTGIKTANPKLTVVGFSGDGDSLAEGLSHLIHAAERNTDVKLFLHDNQVFALTAGQATPRSPLGWKGASTPRGTIENPLDPVRLMLVSGATFVARTYAPDMKFTKDIMKQAILHPGFAFVDIIQPCITFFDTREFYKDRVYALPAPFGTRDEALAAAFPPEKVPMGVFYREKARTFEEALYG